MSIGRQQEARHIADSIPHMTTGNGGHRGKANVEQTKNTLGAVYGRLIDKHIQKPAKKKEYPQPLWT